MFDVIRNIDAKDPSSWENKIFLTFDIDWAHDEILADSIDILERQDVSATFFVTHNTPVLERLRENPKFELGIHPNFNFLLQGDARNGSDANEVIDRLLDIVPEARSVRSHSMTQSSRLLDMFFQKGLTHDCNSFVPAMINFELKPWKCWPGLTNVPHFWEDDLAWFYEDDSVFERGYEDRKGLKVFDFHPIHVFLNTQKLDLYEITREIHSDPEKLIHFRNEGGGARLNLLSLLGLEE